MLARRHMPVAVFLLFSLTAYVADAAIVRSHIFDDGPDILALGITIDLTIGVPALFYFLVARRRRWPLLVVLETVVPLFLVGMLATTIILPTGYHHYVHTVSYLLAPLELFAFGYVIYQAPKMLRRYREARERGMSFEERIEFLLRGLTGERVPIGLVVYEVKTWYYALFAWRKAPSVGAGQSAHSYDKRNEYTALLTGLIVLTVFEVPIVHLFLHRWSSIAAWIVAGLSLYGLMWVLGELRATRLLPILLDETALRIRTGLRWDVRVPVGSICEVRHLSAGVPATRTPGYLDASVYGDPQFLITLRAPVVATGVLGFTREVRQIGLSVDEPERFAREIEALLAPTNAAEIARPKS